MQDFDPTALDSYTPVQLADFIENGQLTKEELYNDLGYHASKRPAFEAEWNLRETRRMEREHLPIEDEEMWQWAQTQNTISAYEQYLKKYDTHVPGEYRGVHVFDARQAIDNLREVAEKLRVELFQAMISSPWIFKESAIKNLIFGVSPEEMRRARTQTDVGSRFIATGNTITFDEMKAAGVVPDGFTLDKLTAPDYNNLPQKNIAELGDFPVERRTDVYFLGVPRGGKSSVLAGVFTEMQRRGIVRYVPQYNQEGRDLCNAYYWGLIRAVESSKYPVSTPGDTISFLKLDLKNSSNRVNPLTFVEISGEAFSHIAEGLNGGAEVWNNLGAGQCLRSNNRKLLFFIVDYGVFKGTNTLFRDTDQLQALQNSLTVLSTDGEGPARQKNCTMSKVDTVAVIVTKSDLMGENLPSGVKMDMAKSYLEAKFNGFMNNLYDVCQQFGINRPNGYSPYILTFSLGKLLIGNKCLYDSTDSANIIEFMSSVTQSRSTRGGGIFSTIFGGGQTNRRNGGNTQNGGNTRH